MVPNWLLSAPDIQRSPLSESFRLGPTNVALLQKMFPKRHDQMVSVRGACGCPDDSLVLLTLLPRLTDWQHDEGSGEVRWSLTFATHVATLLALEIVVMMNGEAQNL